MTGACVLCGSGLTGPNRSWEHVIPESLGAKLQTHRVLCRSCNSRTGHDWDATLAQQLLRVSVLVFPERHPLGHRSRRVRDDQGNSLILKGGIRGGAEHPQAIVHKVGEAFDLTISAPTKKRLVQEIDRLVKEGVLPSEQKAAILASATREEALTRAEFEEGGSFGGEGTWRSMLKSMVTAGVLGGLEPAHMLTAVEFLRGSDNGVPNLPIGRSPVRFRGAGELPVRRHCVHVETDAEECAVWGYLELYGTFTAIAQLGTDYTGPPTAWTYCVDPVTGANLTDDITVDLTAPKRLMEEARRAPARVPEIWAEQAPNPQRLVDECLLAHRVPGHIIVTETSYGSARPDDGSTIHEITLLSSEGHEPPEEGPS